MTRMELFDAGQRSGIPLSSGNPVVYGAHCVIVRLQGEVRFSLGSRCLAQLLPLFFRLQQRTEAISQRIRILWRDDELLGICFLRARPH